MSQNYLKKEEREIIADLFRVFGPMDERITKPFVKMVYNSCFGVIIKTRPYVREAMPLAKVLTAQQLEKFITGEEETVIEETLKVMGGESTEIPVNDIATTQDIRTKFID